MLKIATLTTLLLLSALSFNGCSKDKKQESQDANSILATHEFVLTDLNNNKYTITKKNGGFTIDKFKNKIIMFDIFATWCPPCRAEVSHLSSLQKKFKNDLVVIGVTVENGVENAKLQKFKQQYNINYILVNSSQNRRFISELATNLNVGRNFGIPLMAMYKDGKLIRFYQGATEEEFMQSDIEQALGK